MFPETPPPGKDWLLVFVSDDMDAMRAAAAAALAVGYERTAVLDGGVQALTQSALQQVRSCNLSSMMATRAGHILTATIMTLPCHRNSSLAATVSHFWSADVTALHIRLHGTLTDMLGPPRQYTSASLSSPCAHTVAGGHGDQASCEP